MSNMTEKLRPTYDLEAVKEAFSTEEGLSITTTALRNAAAPGLLKADIVAVIHSMTRSQFVKSVTSYGNYRQWQDVYHVPIHSGVLYVKFRDDVVTRFHLLSFKEKDDG